jgi:hypothetical protein
VRRRIVAGAVLFAALAILLYSPLPGRLRRLLPSDRADAPSRRPGDFPQHMADVAAARVSHPRVVWLGDSIASRWLTTGRAAWDRWIAPLSAASLAVGQDRVEHLLWRLESGEFDGVYPEVVVLSIGTNDLSLRPAPEIAAGIARCVADCRRLWPGCRVVAMGVLPRRDRGSVFYREDLIALNRRLADLDDGDRVRFLDLTPYLEGDDRYLRPEYSEDGLHLTAAAYEVWGRVVRPMLGSGPDHAGIRIAP